MNYYEILGVEVTATQAEIKKAFRTKAAACHPDKHPGLSEEEKTEYVQQFQDLERAYACLGDAQARAEYDRTGKAPGGTPLEEWKKLLIQAVASCVRLPASMRNGRLLESVRGKLEKEQVKLQETLVRAQRELQQLEQEKCAWSADEGNFVVEVLLSELRQVDAAVEQARELLAAYRTALDTLDTVKDLREVPAEPSQHKDQNFYQHMFQKHMERQGKS